MSWTSATSTPVAVEKGQLPQGEQLPTRYSYTSIPCTNQLTKVRIIEKYLGMIPHIGYEYDDSCNVVTSFGVVGKDYIQLDGFEGAFKKNGNWPKIIPIPYSNVVYIVNTAGFSAGGVLYRTDNFRGLTRALLVMPDKLDLTGFGEKVKTNNGEQVIIDPDSISVSKNGEWLAGNLVNGKQALISINSPATPPIIFGDSINYFGGFDPKIATSVTGDGKFVAVVDQNKYLNIYNIVFCQNSSGVTGCKKVLDSLLENITSDYKVMRQSFTKDDQLEIYLNGKFGAQEKTTKIFNVFPNQQIADQHDLSERDIKYLAMGDSFASGEGSFNYRNYTDDANNRCHQSLLAYSELASSQLGINSRRSVACSGAKMKDVFYDLTPEGQRAYNEKESQSKGLSGSENNNLIWGGFLPGFRQQIQFIDKYNPNIITLSVSGNDIGFVDKINTCLGRFTTCYSDKSDRYRIFEEIKQQYGRLVSTLEKVKQDAGPDTKIYIIGYPRFFPEDGGDNCPINTPFDLNERRLANDLVHDLNQMVKLSAGAVGVNYIDEETAMNGHFLCGGTNPAFNGLTAGNDALKAIGYPFGKESFHPNQLGQQKMKDVLLAQSQNFTKPNPIANSQVKIDDLSSQLTGQLSDHDLEEFKNLPLLVNDSDLSDDTLTLQGSRGFTVDIKNDKNLLLANTNYQIEIHSTPVSLGTLQTDNAGNLRGDAVLPNDLEEGFHEIHIIGPSNDGKSVDVYKSVYVTSSSISDSSSQDGPAETVDPKKPLGESVAGTEKLVNFWSSANAVAKIMQVAVDHLTGGNNNAVGSLSSSATVLGNSAATLGSQAVNNFANEVVKRATPTENKPKTSNPKVALVILLILLGTTIVILVRKYISRP